MCDLDSMRVVAKERESSITQVGEGCALGGSLYKTQIIGRKAIEKIGGWIAKGWIRGEKGDQYFEALAKGRRGRRVFRSHYRAGRWPWYLEPGYIPVGKFEI